MYPELFKIPIIDLTVKSYGLMMVVGFLSAVFVIRRLSRTITSQLDFITNASLYCLIAGVVGARFFYVLHHFDRFRGNLSSVFAIWQGGLELLGGVILAIVVIILYLRHHKLGVRRYLDILAVGLMLALAFGRIGCFLNGCCFGKPTELPWGVRFPYASFVYRSQTQPDLERNRHEPQLKLPAEFFEYAEENQLWYPQLKPYEKLSQQQKDLVTNGPFRALPVHPTQLYSSANAVILCLILYFFRRRSISSGRSKKKKLFAASGCTFGLMFVLYGFTRFFIEFLRDDNPFEYGWWIIYKGATVSQNMAIYMTILGIILMVLFQKVRDKSSSPQVPRGSL